MSKIIVANHKMNLTLNEIENYLKNIKPNDNIVICPTSIYVSYFLKNYHVGLQNIYLEDKGAYTGEISPLQASSMGITYTIVGHSERRNYFNEDDVMINKKVLASLKNKLNVIVCIGENEEEIKISDKIIKRQLLKALNNVDDFDKIIIAYEPIWAIGTNKTPTNKDISDVVGYIKLLVKQNFKKDVLVLYGGSVNEKNIETLNEIENVDGFLIGGASTDSGKFKKIIEVALK